MREVYFDRVPFCELTSGAACGSGGRVLDETDFARLLLEDGREVLWFNTNHENAQLALGNDDWKDHERIVIYEPEKKKRFSYIKREDVAFLLDKKGLTIVNS